MKRKEKKRTLTEKLYKADVFTDGAQMSIRPIEVLKTKLENPPMDEEVTDGTSKGLL